MTFLSVNSATGECGRSGSLVTCTFGSLAPSETKTALVQVRADVGGVTLVSNADVESSSPDTNTANNHATLTTGVTGAGTRRVWAANAGTASAITVINPDTNTLVGTITLHAPALDIAFSPDGTRAYAVNLNANNIAVIDTATSGVVGNITVNDSGPRQGRRGRYAAVCHDRLEQRLGVRHADARARHRRRGGRFARRPRRRAERQARLRREPEFGFGVGASIPRSNTVVATVNVGSFPVEVALSPNGKRLYVANFFDNSVSVVDTATNTVVTTIDVGSGPQGIAITPDGASGVRLQLQRRHGVGHRHRAPTR